MSDAGLWLPGAVHIPQSQDGGSMTGGPPRVVWHTTESDPGSIAGATSWLVKEQTFPHLIWDPSTGDVNQFIPVSRAGRALMHPKGTPETNRAGSMCVQIEVVGRAAHPFTAEPMKGFEQLVEWLTDLGVVRGHPTASGRMEWSEWATFAGHCGHAHVPGNDHTDPGSIDFALLLGTAFVVSPAVAGPSAVLEPSSPTSPSDPASLEDDMAQTLLERRSSDGAWFAIPDDLSHKSHVVDGASLTKLQADTAHYRTDGLSDDEINAIPDAK